MYLHHTKALVSNRSCEIIQYEKPLKAILSGSNYFNLSHYKPGHLDIGSRFTQDTNFLKK